MKKKLKKLQRDSMGLIATGIGLGVGSQALGDAGSTYGQQAIGKVSSAMPMMGTLAGAGAVMGGLKGLGQMGMKKHKRRRR